MRINITPEGIAITKRFFLALDTLQMRRELRGMKTFTDRYNINYWNLSTLKKEPERRFLKPEWLSHLVQDYGVNANWLLIGVGNMFTKSKSIEL